jgi:signal transduction histidine kinase
MQPSDYNPLLAQQIAQTLGTISGLTEHEQTFFQEISDSYNDFMAEQAKDKATIAQRTEQLIASTSRAYSFLDSINKGFMMCDTSGEVVLTNDSLRAIIAAKTLETSNIEPLRDLSIKAINSLFEPDVALQDLITQCLRTALPIERDEVPFGSLMLRVYLAPLTGQSADKILQLLGVVILVEDITEQKVLERSKDEFLSIASHELRTPLTAIRGNASLMKKYYADTIATTEMTEMIDDIHESAIRLIGIVNDFLDVAAIEQGKMNIQPATFQVQEVIADVIRELEHLCSDKGIVLQTDDSVADVPTVFADKARIKQVIINLIGNAIKFTDQGSITVSTRSDDSFVHIIVTDTGRGMNEANQKLLFHKFQQAGSSILTRDTTKGTGLGLYISKLIVELSGGTIGLQSSVENEGSAFAFSVPIALKTTP